MVRTRTACRSKPVGYLTIDPADFAPATALQWSGHTYKQAVRATAMNRATRTMWQRNAAVILGNRQKLSSAERTALQDATKSDDAMLAEHARWALQQAQSRDFENPSS